jgi:3-oxoacyl-(acyl-carrier-protein) synthase
MLTFILLRVLIFCKTFKIMESLESAMRRGANIIAEYLGGAITCDAHHMTDPRSDGLGVSSCITKSLNDAGVSPEEVKPLVDLKAKSIHQHFC